MWTLSILPCFVLLLETKATNTYYDWPSAEDEPDTSSSSSSFSKETWERKSGAIYSRAEDESDTNSSSFSNETWERKSGVETKAENTYYDWPSAEDESDTNSSSFSNETWERKSVGGIKCLLSIIGRQPKMTITDINNSSFSIETWERRSGAETKVANGYYDWPSIEDASDSTSNTRSSSYSDESWGQKSSEDESSSVTDSPITCPPEKSLLTKKDIRHMIDYVAEFISVYKDINSSYYSKAIEVRDKHINDLKEFQAWFEDRPEHLKHVLDDLNFLKNHIEPSVKRVADVLKEYSSLEENFQEKLEKTKELLNNLERSKVICLHNCQIKCTSLTGIEIVKKGDYYCSSMGDLYENINISIKKFVINITSKMETRITNDDNMYTNKISELKNKLKDIALKEFGNTMYDVLILQDDYHHFIENILRIDTKSIVHIIKESNLLIDSKLLTLEKRIEKYGAYCRSCNDIVTLTKLNQQKILEYTQEKPNNILDELLNLKYKQIESKITENYLTLFKELNSLLSNIKSATKKSSSFKPIQDEITERLRKERANFNELKSIVPQSAITKLLKLSTDTAQLFSNITETIDSLYQFSLI